MLKNPRYAIELRRVLLSDGSRGESKFYYGRKWIIMAVLLRIPSSATGGTRLKRIVELNTESRLVSVNLLHFAYSPLLSHIRQILCAERLLYIMLMLMVNNLSEIKFRHVHMYDIYGMVAVNVTKTKCELNLVSLLSKCENIHATLTLPGHRK